MMKRRRLSADAWTAMVEKFEGSGLSAEALIVTSRLQGIDPYTYLVDVLQRVAIHPASRVADLTPRLWKQHFAVNPMRSDLHFIES